MKQLFIGALFLLFIFTSSVHAQTTNWGMDESSCSEDGLCVIFEVTVDMSKSVDTPQNTVRTEHLRILNRSRSYSSSIDRFGDKCRKQVRVPQPVFMSIVELMAGLKGSEGEPRPAFTPAQQTILLFYTTLMQQTLQFNCSHRELNPSHSSTVEGAES